ncbi:SOS response-associated peptidase family protein [Paraburkholderia sp. J63]|uniref:SOS response-associated peptidase family protein n=1 Tax=Paraburkholderia sp. J63 TaxID=2805434 RepID=UPI002ABDB681|nr:SOS response-associated peptidase family protein [Paraburkholderia sp. J63]
MCTNYRAPDELDLPAFSDLKIDLGQLWARTPWKPEVWPDYDAPGILPAGEGTQAALGAYGFWPKFLQPERRDPQGRKKKPYDTYNARGEEVGSKPLYAAAWRAGQRCLIPARYVVEPCWESGKNVWHRIGLTGWAPFAVAGIWKRYETQRGPVLGVSMLTLNAEGHAVMGRMHRPTDEKRAVVILRPEDYDEWLHTPNVEAARTMLRLWPAGDMVAEPAGK